MNEQLRSRAFPRSSRLLKHGDFQRVYQQGQRHFSTNMTVFFLRRQDEDASGPRIGFTVSRALGGAVERNRMKRRLREAVRHRLGALHAPVDVVINPKKTVLRAEFAHLLEEVERAFATIERRTHAQQQDEPASK